MSIFHPDTDTLRWSDAKALHRPSQSTVLIKRNNMVSTKKIPLFGWIFVSLATFIPFSVAVGICDSGTVLSGALGSTGTLSDGSTATSTYATTGSTVCAKTITPTIPNTRAVFSLSRYNVYGSYATFKVLEGTSATGSQQIAYFTGSSGSGNSFTSSSGSLTITWRVSGSSSASASYRGWEGTWSFVVANANTDICGLDTLTSTNGTLHSQLGSALYPYRTSCTRLIRGPSTTTGSLLQLRFTQWGLGSSALLRLYNSPSLSYSSSALLVTLDSSPSMLGRTEIVPNNYVALYWTTATATQGAGWTLYVSLHCLYIRFTIS